MTTTHQIPSTESTPASPSSRAVPAWFSKGQPASQRSASDFAGDPESYRHDDGRPGAKDHKPQRGGKRGAVWIC